MKKEGLSLILFTALFATTSIISITKFIGYSNKGLDKVGVYISKSIDESEKKSEKNNKEEIKKERIKENNVLYYDGYVDLVQRQLVADYINFFNRAIKKHPKELTTQKISFIGKRPLLGDVFYHTVNVQIYRTSNYFNDYDALLVTEDGNNYVFQSQKCKLNYKTEKVDIIKTEGPGNRIGYFMLPKASPDDFSYIPDCTILKLLKAE